MSRTGKRGLQAKHYGKAPLPGENTKDAGMKNKHEAKDAAQFFPKLKPMLAEKMGELDEVTYPVLATPKIDGIRCLTGVGGEALSRTLKNIPNLHIQEEFAKWGMEGLDGELWVHGGTDEEAIGFVSGSIMRVKGEPDFEYKVFDVWDTPSIPYSERMEVMKHRLKTPRPPWVTMLLPVKCTSVGGVLKYWKKCGDEGYEGAMIRDPDGRYKYGRSTKGGLMKLKIFQDDEAEVIGFEEMMHNKNPAEKDAFGRTKRSTSKKGKVGAGVLGKWKARDLKTGIEFECGTGYTAKQRADFWRDRQVFVGEVFKYKHQPSGALSKPRFPVFLGWRHKDDM